jgi:hypothetical protein
VAPDSDRRWVLRVPTDPYLRFDTCDYSLDPRLVGRRVEVPITDREVLAVSLDTGELACRHQRSFARHRRITAFQHARTLKTQRHERARLRYAHRGSFQPPRGSVFGRRYGVKFRAALTSFVYLAFVSLLKLADPLRPDP